MDLIYYLLVSISFSQLWNHSKVMSYFRIKLIKVPIARDALLCPECSSFWVGLLVSLAINPFNNIPIVISNIFCGVVCYAICGILYKKEILTHDHS